MKKFGCIKYKTMETKMTCKSKTSQKGFTLVELSIVLVIIGLIVSGVLAGRDLIKAAELRATVRQVQSFQTAVNTFIGKYNGIPGDVTAATYGLVGGVATTNADGFISDLTGGTAASSRNTYNGEISNFWSELTSPGKELIPGIYNGHEGAAAINRNDVVNVNMPKMKFGNSGWGVFTDGVSNYFVTGVPGDDGVIATDAYLTSNIFVPIELYNMDVKMDDGLPASGDVQAVGGAAADPNTAAASNVTASLVSTDCYDSTANANTYYMAATTANCNARFTMKTF